MLQQTRVDTVTPYFERFMERFPTPLVLAETPEDQVLAAWSGLGYYRRARMLHAGARHVAEGGAMPRDRDGLLSLPGIGRYTAGAIASIAYGERVGLVDGNVARVFARLFGIDDDMKSSKAMKRAEALSETLVAKSSPGDWNQALMELGATVCTPRSPTCEACPVSELCVARRDDRVHLLPVIGEKKKPKPQSVQALVARSKDGAQVLLARRRSDGLFGGLWEPPSLDGGPEVKDDLLGRFPIDPKTVSSRGRVTHVLSHRRLTIDVHAAVLTKTRLGSLDLPPAYEAADLFAETAIAHDQGRIGLATLARKVLSAKANKRK